MGEIRSDITLKDTLDRGLVDRGHGEAVNVRHSTVDGIVTPSR